MAKNQMKKTFPLIYLMILFLTPILAQSSTINVPSSEHPTIQAGIDASVDGDIILLADGTYTGYGNYNVDFNGKSITVKSSGGPDVCIVDCEGTGRGFLVYSGETVTFEGLTVKNGYAGGGNDGGGIYANGSEIIVVDCIFDVNNASSGGAVYSSGAASFANCTFNSNGASLGAINGDGGGAVRSSHNSTSTSFTDCVFTDNRGATGGAVYANGDSTLFTNCTFTFNTALYGGAISANGSSTSFTNNIFISNTSSSYGGAVLGSSSSALFTNCAFISNSAPSGGAVIARSVSYNYCYSSFTNCTFTLNDATEQGGAIYCDIPLAPKDPITLKNCILYGNTAPEGSDIYEKEKPLIITYSDIQGGHTGAGNIDSDPLFINANNDFHLQHGSPCIDTGTADGAPADDLDGNPRPMGSGFDMGAYELQSSITIIISLTASPNNGAPPLTVNFTCTATDSASTITAYDWAFGDGNTQTTSSETTQHTYNSSGSFTASCTVKNSAGEQSSQTVSIAVNNDSPVADAGSDQIVPGNSVQLDGSGSSDPDGSIVSWSWALEHLDNSTYDKAATGETPTVANLEYGNYTVTLTVTDNNGGTGTDEMHLSVAASSGSCDKAELDKARQEGYDQGYLEGMDEGLNNSGNTIAGIIEEGANGEKIIEGPVIIKGTLVVE